MMEVSTDLFMDRVVLYIAYIASFTAVNVLTPRCSYLFIHVQCVRTQIAKLIFYCQRYPGGVVLKDTPKDHFCINEYDAQSLT